MNTKTMFSSRNDTWETPQDFFDKLDDIFHFDIDVCATADNAKCSVYYTPEDDGLQHGRAHVGAIRRTAET